MKITADHITQIIQEEMQNVIDEKSRKQRICY